MFCCCRYKLLVLLEGMWELTKEQGFDQNMNTTKRDPREGNTRILVPMLLRNYQANTDLTKRDRDGEHLGAAGRYTVR